MEKIIYREYLFSEAQPWFAFLAEQECGNPALAGQHFHNCMELGFCREVEGDLFVEGKSWAIRCNSFFVVPPYAVHFTKLRRGTVEYLYFDANRIKKQVWGGAWQWESSNIPGILPMFYPKEESPFLFELVACLMKDLKEEQLGNVGLLAALLSQLEEEKENRSPVSQALVWLREHYMEEVRGEMLAAICGLSEGEFRRKFRESVGVTLSQYISDLRIRSACNLLLQSEKSILEIAMQVGFLSLSSFNNTFKRQMKESPRAWRESRRLIHKDQVFRLPYKGNL